jgi:hypothetical protein
MNLRAIAVAAATAPLVLVFGVALTAAAAGTIDPAGCGPPIAAPTVSATGSGAATGIDLDAAQRANAQIIYSVGAQLKLPHRAGIIAIATALQESHLVNLGDLGANNDYDSLGLFQQRPSQGWGTPAQILNPVYAAKAFYTHLAAITGWQNLPLTDAAQAVQKSAFPEAYAKWEPLATQLAAEAASHLGITITADPTTCVQGAGVFQRAQWWLTAWSGGPVPYLSSGDSADWFRGYRRDCSGYVSMALGLPGPGLNTLGLANRSTVITKTELRPGDLLINTAPDLAGHVVIFERWTDTSMTRYYGYEQSGDGGTHHRAIPYPYFGDYPLTPYRFVK